MTSSLQAQLPFSTPQTATDFRLIDMFSGCGGMTLGFISGSQSADSQAPQIRPVWAIDNNKTAIESYQANFDPQGHHSLCGDVIELFQNEIEIPQADIVIGGPPCQGFSLLNKNREGDERRELWWYFLEAARLSNARVVVMENVRQLISSEEFQDILHRLDELGFKNRHGHVLVTSNYGVPQVRHRTILMASRVGPISLPRPTHLKPDRLNIIDPKLKKRLKLKPWLTVKDAIFDLPKPEGTTIRPNIPSPLNIHIKRNPTKKSLERYKAVPPGGNRFDLLRNRPDITPACWVRKKSGGTDLFGRLWWDRPSVTIRTEFYKPEKGRYLHPDEDRAITLREGARLQTFPDDFIFKGTARAKVARQIGNAVPPKLAEAIAHEVTRCLLGETTEEYIQETNQIFNLLLNENIGNGYM